MTTNLKERVQNLIEEMYNKADLGAADEYISPGILRHHPPFADIQGLEAYKQYVSGMYQVYGNLHIEIHEILAERNTTVVRFTLSGIHSAASPTLGHPPTYQPVSAHGCNVSHWDGEKLAQEWIFFDFLGMSKQMESVAQSAR